MSNSDNFSFDNFRLSQSIDLQGFANQYGLNNSISNVNNRYNLNSFNDFSQQLAVDQQQLQSQNNQQTQQLQHQNNNHQNNHHQIDNMAMQQQLHNHINSIQLNNIQQNVADIYNQQHQQTTTTTTSTNNGTTTTQQQLQQLLQQLPIQQQNELMLLQQRQAAQAAQLEQQQKLQQLQLQLAQAQMEQQTQNELARLQMQITQMEQTFISGDLITELTELLSSLEMLAQESIQHLYFLCKILQPQLTEELRFPLLSKMFKDMPQMIPLLSITNYQTFLSDPNNHAFKMFMDFKELANLFAKITYLQLFHLTNNLIPQGSPQFQFSIFLKVQEYFRHTAFERLRILNSSLDGDQSLNNTFLHVQKIMTLDPSIPIDIIHLVAGIISLPLSDLYLFHHWFGNLSKKLLAVLLALLQLDSSTVLDLKRILATSVSFSNLSQSQSNTNIIPPTSSNNNNNNNNSNNSGFSLPIPQLFPNNSNTNNNIDSMNIESPKSPVQINYQSHLTSHHIENHSTPSSPYVNYKEPQSPIQTQQQPVAQPTPTKKQNTTTTTSTNNTTTSSTSVAPTNQLSDSYYLKIARQPPPSTVYQRILKPFPQVMVCGPGVESENLSNFYVEATLLRNDDNSELVNCIDGTKTSRISGVFAPFKKLKILSTTQQLRTLFRLKFVLKRYVRNESHTFPEATVLSDPIEVFSHTIYLIDKQDVPLPPTVTEIIPAMAKPGTRVVILGSNFSNGNDLKVFFGSTSVAATFYEKGTIICQVPPNATHSSNAIIKVTNDGNQYSSESNVVFNYIP